MTAHVLVVEDDEATRGALRALLDDAGYDCDEVADGERAVAAVRDNPFDLVVLDLGLPGISGTDVHRLLRKDPRTRFLPIVFLTAHTDRQVKLAELEAGAEDYITKPYDADELLARVGSAVRRWSGMRSVNPLSGLPGNSTITEEIDARLARDEEFALLYVDIDRFKEFNDYYGFTRGDCVITMLSEILVQVAADGHRFVGHIGGDDFVALTRIDEAEVVAEAITRRFDAGISALYDADDRARGWIEVHDRRGRLRRIALATVSIGIVNVRAGRFEGATAAARAAAEVKEVAKRQAGSTWAVDRRRS